MLNEKKILAVIPARYAASRLPGKLLMDLHGQSVIERVYRQVTLSDMLDRVIIATDDIRIKEHAVDFGAEVIMTSVEHKNGTSRCMEVLECLDTTFDYMINVQGDEPFVQHDEIEYLLKLMHSQNAQIGTLASPILASEDMDNPHIVKVVRSASKRALYFSRSSIPFSNPKNPKKESFLQHIGLYIFTTDVLRRIQNLTPSELELSENLEQLRWLENDLSMVVGDALHAHIGIDTIEDLEMARNRLKNA